MMKLYPDLYIDYWSWATIRSGRDDKIRVGGGWVKFCRYLECSSVKKIFWSCPKKHNTYQGTVLHSIGFCMGLAFYCWHILPIGYGNNEIGSSFSTSFQREIPKTYFQENWTYSKEVMGSSLHRGKITFLPKIE
uniref:Uncharacterized protein n=1 Tax=Cacopsylla melanoneura TaxID=428564 RepID=A0A8D9EZN6_9HEMI